MSERGGLTGETPAASEIIEMAMSYDRRLVRAIRQVLMTDLGMTREMIREIVRQEVEAVVARNLEVAPVDRFIESSVRNQVWTTGGATRQMVIDAISREAERFVRENVSITARGDR